MWKSNGKKTTSISRVLCLIQAHISHHSLYRDVYTREHPKQATHTRTDTRARTNNNKYEFEKKEKNQNNKRAEEKNETGTFQVKRTNGPQQTEMNTNKSITRTFVRICYG